MDYSADFETTTNVDDCRVWAWCVCEIENVENIWFGNSIDTFLDFCYKHGGTYYFHNAAFDCEFIISYLLKNGFKHSVDKTLKTKEFSTLINAQGKFFKMDICFLKRGKHKASKAEFKDSLKKLPMPVSAIAKAFNLPISKLEIDYTAYREPGHVLTQEEKDYIKNDVQIVAMALNTQFNEGLTKLTIASDAMGWYKNIVGKHWDNLFPTLDLGVDAMIRKSYRGGWTYAAPQFQATKDNPLLTHGAGSVYDVNSLYPDVMYNRPLPVGEPVWYEGEYTADEQYPLYIQFLTCAATIKKDHLPTLQIKNNPFYSEHEYITDTDGTVELALTSVDLELLFNQYDVTVFSYNGGYKFMQKQGLFKTYIDYWSEIKANSTGGKRRLAKLMLNSLYGKFATNPDVTQKRPEMLDDGSLHYVLMDKEYRDPVYTPMGCFITAWARFKTISAAQAVYPRFMYADTDSIHLLGQDIPDNLDVHPTRLGAWKNEGNFDKARYLRAKTYIEHMTQEGAMIDGKYTMVDVEPYMCVKCAGMPNNMKSHVSFDEFTWGLQADKGKLRPKHVDGGIVLVDVPFSIV